MKKNYLKTNNGKKKGAKTVTNWMPSFLTMTILGFVLR
jgi:hypothetical protein